MINFFIALVSAAVCGVLDALGGYHWLFCRRFIMPSVIGVVAAIITHTWWVLFLPLPAMGTLCLGYSKDGNAGRALWLFIQAIALGLGLTIFGHLPWYFFAPYAVGAGVLGGLYKNWQQKIGDFITGAYLGGALLLIH